MTTHAVDLKAMPPVVEVKQRSKRLVRGALEAEVLGLMSDCVERGGTDVARRLGRNPKSVYAALQRLVDSRRLVKTGGRYRLKLRNSR